MRNMAYAVTISKIDDIEGKDRIGLGHFEENAYTVIVPKTYKVGDVVCYFEVDSILPEEPRFEFLRKRCYNKRVNGFLIKKMKIGEEFSYGLTMTSSELGITIEKGKVYDEVLNVRKDEDKYDASPKTYIKGVGTVSRPFPSDLIPKSDEDNILNNPELFEKVQEMNTDDYYASIKLEGKSMTVYLGERTIFDIVRELGDDFAFIRSELSNIFKKISHRKFDIMTHIKNIMSLKNPFRLSRELMVFGRNAEGDNEMKEFSQRMIPFFKKHPNIVLQGEFTSPKVQKGIYKNGTNFYVYRARNGKRDLTPDEFGTLIEMAGIPNVQTVEYIKLDLKDYNLDLLQKFVDTLKFKEGSSKLDPNGNKLHEGLVIRTADMKIHFKVKNREYNL